MKKFFLIIGMSVFSLALFAEGIPAVTVSKSQGGWTAILNMYNYVTYTPAEVSANGVAQLTCVGNGFSFCRVPNCSTLNVNDGQTVVHVSDQTRISSFVNAMNNVLEQMEEEENEAALSGNKNVRLSDSKSKKIAFPNPSARGKLKQDTYVVKAVRTGLQTQDGMGTVNVYIDKVNL